MKVVSNSPSSVLVTLGSNTNPLPGIQEEKRTQSKSLRYVGK